MEFLDFNITAVGFDKLRVLWISSKLYRWVKNSFQAFLLFTPKLQQLWQRKTNWNFARSILRYTLCMSILKTTHVCNYSFELFFQTFLYFRLILRESLPKRKFKLQQLHQLKFLKRFNEAAWFLNGSIRNI